LIDVWNPCGNESAHIAFDSLCFSKPSASTRWWSPDSTSVDATIAVEPPTDPAVWTRITGFPTPPSASARMISGIITPSKKSGAFPITIASMSFHSSPASASARSAASRTRPAIDTSPRVAWYFVWPTPMTAHRSLATATRPPAR